MKLKVIISTGLFIFGFLISAFAETSVKAEVDKTRITTDETITYKLIISSSEKNLPTPEVPKFADAGFIIISQSQSSNISFQGGKINTVLAYAFVLSPTDIGKMKIEPSSIKIKDDTYSTDAFEIEIKPGKRKPSIPQESPAEPEQHEQQQQQPQITL